MRDTQPIRAAMSRVVYSRRYNISFYGLEKLHAFDSKKYGRAWRLLKSQLGSSRLRSMHSRPFHPVSDAQLRLVHASAYLDSLRDSTNIAAALELPPLENLPAWLIDRHILKPMRWATAGTILAAEEALRHGFAANLGGGYHHAKPDRGEGFSIYADAGIAIAHLRRERLIEETAQVIYIDTDAHQGNGVCHVFQEDPRVSIFDIYNSQIYPSYDAIARRRIDCDIPLGSGTGDDEYLRCIESHLPSFLDAIPQKPALAIYNAGTDVYQDDPLGMLNLSAGAVLKRDLHVMDELQQRQIPAIFLLSGGYTRQSHQMIANSLIRLLA